MRPAGNFPEFLDALPVGLRVAVTIQSKARDELLGQRAARAFGKNHYLGLQIVARLEVRFGLVLLVHTLVVGANAGDAVAIFFAVEEQFRSGESGEDGDAGFFHLAAQPLHKPVQRNDVIAVIAQWRRRDGKLEFAFLGQEVNRFFRDFGVDRRFLLESGKQFAHGAGIEQRPGKTVLADLASLLEHVDIFFAELRIGMLGVVLIDELREPQRTSHACRPAADDDDIGGHLGAFNASEGFAEN